MNRKRSSMIAACGLLLAGAVLPAPGASRTTTLRVTADVVAACEVRVTDHLLPDTRAAVAMRCTQYVPWSIGLDSLPHDARSGAPHLLALVSF